MSDVLVSRFSGAALDARREGEAAPRRRRVYVDRDGRIVVGDDVPGGREGEERPLSEVHPAVFA
jgi:hypothetical protein